MTRTALAALGASALALAAPFSFAQGYPTKPVRVIVPYPAGGADVFLRLITPKMSESLGQSVVVDNRAGANGVIGTAEAAKAAPDGYVILFGPSSSQIGAKLLMKAATYDPVKDFTPITTVHESPMLLTVHPSLPVQSVKELVDYAKKNPGKLSYGTVGNGSVMHLNGEVFLRATGTEMLAVPYAGLPALVNDTLGGRVQVGFSTLASTVAQAQAGKLRAIAILEPRTLSILPGVPSVSQTIPGFRKPAAWTGLFGPAGLPRPIVARLNEAAVRALAAADVREAFEKAHGVALGATPEETRAYLESELELTTKVVKEIGLQPE